MPPKGIMVTIRIGGEELLMNVDQWKTDSAEEADAPSAAREIRP
jgi:hypothetical protein